MSESEAPIDIERRILPPKERLKEFLKDVEPGSPEIQAIADTAEFKKLNAEFDNCKNTEQRIIVAASIGAVSETIRKNRFGPNSKRYNEARIKADSLVDWYIDDVKNRNKNNKPQDEASEEVRFFDNVITYTAAYSILDDLGEICDEKSAPRA